MCNHICTGNSADVNKSNRTTMRPLGVYLIGIDRYLECDKFPDEFGRFRRFFLNVNGRTDIRTDIPSYRDARTHLKSVLRQFSALSRLPTMDIFL